jgi:CBS domain-containing protein
MIRVENILPKARARLVVIRNGQQLTEAAALLSEPNRHMVVVCGDDGAMVGVVTRTDIVREIRHCQGCSCTTPCAAVMTQEVIVCSIEDRLHDVWTIMKAKGLQSVPIVDPENRPIGLLSAADVLEVLLSEVEYEEELLKDYVMCVGYR